MRVGSFVFTTDQGLGILAKSFFDNGVVTDVMIIAHGRRPEHDEWYPQAKKIHSLRNQDQQKDMADFCLSMDAMLFFETPFEWRMIDICREAGVKTFLSVMHECMPDPLPWQPDYFLCPSLLDLQWAETNYPNVPRTFIPVPVQVPFRQRERALVFVHNAGNGGLSGRNGTRELVDAMQLVKSPSRLVLRCQEGQFPGARNITRDMRTFTHAGLWASGGDGDVFVFPERFNGLSLPLQEARAAGMLVIATDRFPINKWLLKCETCKARNRCLFFRNPGPCKVCNSPYKTVGEYRNPCPLIPIAGTRKARVSPRCCEFDEAIIRPQDIASKIDEWYGRDISEYSSSGAVWAAEMSWEKLKPRYLELLGAKCG